MALGAKTGGRLMNLETDTILYSSFCTCTNVSFRYISHCFTQNCIKLVQFIFQPLNISVFKCFCWSLWLWELKLAKDDKFGQRYTFLQLFLHLYKYVFQMSFKIFHSKLHKIRLIYISSIKNCSF